ncbi:MAG: hypothetical protein SPL30_08945 [Succinivibrio sp.]|nr:hypothetical protein [Succinivibrio sp.]
MKRDWMLFKKLLAGIENETLDACIANEVPEEQERMQAHLEMLSEAGLVTGDAEHRCITMRGYDLLCVLSNKKVWDKVCDMACKAGLRLSWLYVQQAAPVAIKSLF